MLGWSLAFFVAAIIAAMFGFGVVASTFAGIAMILFWVFVGLLLVSLILGVFNGRSHAAGGHGAGAGSTLGLVAVAAVAGILVYSWVQNDWSAQEAGRALDEGAAQLAAETGEAFETAGARAENLIENTGDQMRDDAADGLDQASDTIDDDEQR